MNLAEVLIKASDNELEFETAISWASEQGYSLVEFVNDFAIELARGYRDSKYDYEFCDGAANWLSAFMTEKKFLESNCNTIPSPAWDIYLAFDEGEYQHRGDADDVVPHEKYTMPRILEILNSENS
ncbi:hypothetical protein [Pleionea sediminis]|uniref:hypothetical protein n=1 Tax=Pleionea sediminis TaxID=2569479 RepID=UPI0011872962|nr:hypothetical protein [Pleionea sediminis]